MKKLFLLLLVLILAVSVSAEKIHPNLEKVLDKTEKISVIVQFDEKPNNEHKDILKNNGCIPGYVTRHMNLIVAECPGKSLKGLSQAGKVQFIWEDETLSPALDVSAPQISAPDAWNNGYDGSGINIALLDTGINTSNMAFQNSKIVLEKDFTNDNNPTDFCDHGTHTASVIISQNSTYNGIAHGANLFNVKIGSLVPPNSGCGASVSDIFPGIDWSIENGAHLIVLIVGSSISNCSFSIMAAYINQTALEADIPFIVPAGNGGPGNKTIWTPGCTENAITVGAVDDSNVIASFSSRGPVIEEITRIKPDVVAPGVQIISAHQTGGFHAIDGTSLSTPHAAAVAALLLQARPGLSFTQVKDVLKNSAKDLGYDENTQGKGLVNATAAISLALNTIPDDFPGALFYYSTSIPDKPKVRNILSDNTFSSEKPLLSLGSDADFIWIRSAESPVRNETAIVTQDDLSSINIQIRKYQQPRNLKKLTNTTGGNAERKFDVAYEANGRAIVVYGNNTAIPAYEVWDGFNYVESGTLAADDCTGNVTWIELASKPTGSEVIAMYQDSNGNYCGQVWNGSAWSHTKKFATDAGTATQKFDIAYEQSSGQALAVFETSKEGVIDYCAWDGSSWCSVASSLSDRGKQNDWVKLASQISSDRLLLGALQFANSDKDFDVIEWNGSSFGTWTQIDGSIEIDGDRIMDIAYVGTGGKGMVVFVDADADIPSYATCANASDCFAGTWSSVSTTTNSLNCGEAVDLDYLGLVPDPLSNKLLLYGITQGNHTKCTQFYDGNWGTWNSNLTSGSVASNAEDITAVFDKV